MSDAVLDDARARRRARSAAETDPPQRPPNVIHDRWSLQLAALASQHHTSEYNRIKYGHRGCPVPYNPLSLHLPDVVRGLRERQQKCADQVLWWPCLPSAAPPGGDSGPLIPAAMQRAALAAGQAMSHPELQRELSDALSETITIQHKQLDTSISALDIKTSETHPINVSQIIPPELLAAISSHLSPCKNPCPVLFDIHLPYSLDQIAGYPQPFSSHVDLPIRSAPIPPVSQHKYLPSNDPRSSLTGAVNAALSTKLSLPPLPVPSSRIFLSFKRNVKTRPMSTRIPEDDVADVNPKLAPCHTTLSFPQATSQTPQSSRSSMCPLPTTYALHPFIHPPTASSPQNKISKFRASKPSTTSFRQGEKHFRLGNLLLSSCPGKKVRLSGPVRGRSTVCRDLDVDLRRMKMLGVRCVVCCLDDEELAFLIGTSWLEYCQVAHREGLDVLRIPLPEGLTPLSPKSLDADLDRIIERYTLQGISVLVHCRGGVGRAGLFACCWMLKLGLCGWIETDTPSTTTSMAEIKRDDNQSDTLRWDSETGVRRDTLKLVERAIEVVRRRRSVKAIETLEQVQFLVEYVDYLRARGHAGGDSNRA